MQNINNIQSLGIIQDVVLTTPHASSGTFIVANVSATSTTYTIANQPDVPRELTWTLAPGASAVTAGTLTITYINELGATQVDAFPIATASGASLSGVTSHVCKSLTSAAIAAIAGGTSPTFQMGVNNVLGLVSPIEPASVAGNPGSAISSLGFAADMSILSLAFGTSAVNPTLDQPPAAVQSNNFKFTPSTIPNGTNNYYIRAMFFGGGAV